MFTLTGFLVFKMYYYFFFFFESLKYNEPKLRLLCWHFFSAQSLPGEKKKTTKQTEPVFLMIHCFGKNILSADSQQYVCWQLNIELVPSERC